MKFPALEYGPKEKRVSKTGVSGPDSQATFKVFAETKTALQFRLEARKAGTYVATVELSPHDIDLTPDKVAEYFAEIDAPKSLRDTYAAMPEPRQWRETYTKHAKTVVCVVSCSTANELVCATGAKAEFVAVAESLGSDRPKFRLLAAGAPLANAAVAVLQADGARTLSHR